MAVQLASSCLQIILRSHVPHGTLLQKMDLPQIACFTAGFRDAHGPIGGLFFGSSKSFTES